MLVRYSALKQAAPATSLVGDTFWHGSKKLSGVAPILREGLKGRPTQEKSRMAPVKEGVYLTPNFRYAMIYALGGSVIGHKYIPSNIKEEPYGFIYEIEPKNLSDVHPDEDSIGELIYSLYRESRPELSWLKYLAESVATPTQLKKLKQGEYALFAAVGKKVLKQLSPKQEIQLLGLPEIHIFNSGQVPVSGCYILKRDFAHLLTGDLDADAPVMEYITDISGLNPALSRLERTLREYTNTGNREDDSQRSRP